MRTPVRLRPPGRGCRHALWVFQPPTAPDAQGYTSLHIAVNQSHQAVVELLLKMGAEVRAENAVRSQTPPLSCCSPNADCACT